MSAPASETAPANATPEGLPDLTKLPEEERDAAWVKHYYRGDDVPQLTLRAVVMGGLLGAAMSVSNLYTTLKLGWAFGVAITACVLSYAIWNGFLGMRVAKTQMTILENNCMQSTASAAGYSTGGTLATAVGALLLMNGDENRLGWFPVACWVLLTALLGVFLAIPMKRQMINSEQLPFPSGIAAAETLRSLYAKGEESVLKARALIDALLVGVVVAFVRAVGFIPESIGLDFRLWSIRGTTFKGGMLAGFAFEPSLLLIAAGMIVGIRVSTWMFLGSALNYLVLMPVVMDLPDWTEDGKTFVGEVESASLDVGFGADSSEVAEPRLAGVLGLLEEEPDTHLRVVGFARDTEADAAQLAAARGAAVRDAIVAHGIAADRIEVGEPEVIDSRNGSRRALFLRVDPQRPERHLRPIPLAIVPFRWSLWLGTALLVASGLTSFALGYRTILRAIRGFGQKKEGGAASVERLEVPMSWLIVGGVPITIGLTLLCWLAFDIAPWLGVISVVLSFVLALVACRATGETDTTPIGAMGKITQFTYALLAPGNTTVNLMTAGITAGAAGSSADLLTDLKSGYLLGANPRKQFLAQFFGVFFGVVAVIPAWYLLVPNQAALEAFNSPATSMWYAVAQALSRGIETIPASARMAIAIGGIVGIALALVEGLAPKSWKTWAPSSMGLGLAMVVPFQNSFSFFIGAVLATIWARVHPKSAERYIIPIASGAVAGESLASAAGAMMGAAELDTHWGSTTSYALVTIASLLFAFVVGRTVYHLRAKRAA